VGWVINQDKPKQFKFGWVVKTKKEKPLFLVASLRKENYISNYSRL